MSLGKAIRMSRQKAFYTQEAFAQKLNNKESEGEDETNNKI